MKLGQVAAGVIRTFRYFRGSEVVHNRFGQISIDANPRGGICFFFEIDYNKGTLLFTSAITREDESFNKAEGRKICLQRAETDAGKTFSIPLDANQGLLEQVFSVLNVAQNNGELGDKPYLRTLLAKMALYDQQNLDSANFYQDMLDAGVIRLPD